jgi:DNA-binding response OmpR family regulator
VLRIDEMDKKKVLLVEDDSNTVRFVKKILESEGYDLHIAGTLKQARNNISKTVPNLIILDRHLPDGDGLELCREIRLDGRTKKVPMLFLTAKGSISDKIAGFKIGGDDYLTKPFHIEELLARIDAMLRRTEKTAEPSVGILKTKGIILDISSHECKVNGTPVSLWPKEFELLKVLIERKGKVLNKSFLGEYVWDKDSFTDSRAIEITVQRLRKKLGKRGNIIETVKGYGFKLNDA